MAKHNYIFQIKLDRKDFEILVKYGFDFETNFEETAKSTALQLRIYEGEHEEEENND